MTTTRSSNDVNNNSLSLGFKLNGKEMFTTWIFAMTNEGIKQEFSDTGMAFQNGLAEVMGGKLVSMVRAMLVRSGAPQKLWSFALEYATWIHNRTPLRRQDGKTTPIQSLTGERSNLSRARVFGRRAERAVHLGVSMEKKAWIFLLLDSDSIVESRNAMMIEEVFPFKTKETHDDDNDGSAAQGGEENGAASPTRRISFAPLPPRRSTRVSVPPERFANVNFDKIARNVEFAMLTGEVSEMQSDPTSL